MKAELAIPMDHPDRVRSAVAPSLRDSDAVSFEIGQGDGLDITVQAETLGTLRGAVNTALMLTKLSQNMGR